MLFLIALSLTPTSPYHLYKESISTIINQMIALSSLKYSVVLLRGLICKLAQHTFSKFIVLSNMYAFGALLFDPTLEDLKALYREFKEVAK